MCILKVMAGIVMLFIPEDLTFEQMSFVVKLMWCFLIFITHLYFCRFGVYSFIKDKVEDLRDWLGW